MKSRKIEKRRSLISAARGLGHWLSNLLLNRKMTVVPIAPLDLVYRIKPNTIFSWNLVKYRAFESDNTNFITSNYPFDSGGLFVDVGANFGWYTCLFAKIAAKEGKVIAFEPDRENRSLLLQNLECNRLSNVTINPCAVGEKEGRAHLLHAPDTNPGMHSIVAMPHTKKHADSQEIRVTSLDEALNDYQGSIRLLKIDIEGYEIDALLGASKTLARCDAVLVEYSPSFLAAAGRRPYQLIQIMQDAGFEIYRLSEGVPVKMDAEALKEIEFEVKKWYYHQVDLLCIKKPH